MVKANNGYTLRCSVFFCKFVNGLTERYPEIFDADHGDTGQHQIRFSKKWRAYATIAELANGNIKEIDGVIGEPLEKCLMLLAYKADKQWLQEVLHKEALKRMG